MCPSERPPETLQPLGSELKVELLVVGTEFQVMVPVILIVNILTVSGWAEPFFLTCPLTFLLVILLCKDLCFGAFRSTGPNPVLILRFCCPDPSLQELDRGLSEELRAQLLGTKP